MIPPDEILLCGYCGLEARIVRLKAGGIEHVIGYQRHPFTLAAPRPASNPSIPVGLSARTGAPSRTPRVSLSSPVVQEGGAPSIAAPSDGQQFTPPRGEPVILAAAHRGAPRDQREEGSSRRSALHPLPDRVPLREHSQPSMERRERRPSPRQRSASPLSAWRSPAGGDGD